MHSSTLSSLWQRMYGLITRDTCILQPQELQLELLVHTQDFKYLKSFIGIFLKEIK